jgi:hypothetical protein
VRIKRYTALWAPLSGRIHPHRRGLSRLKNIALFVFKPHLACREGGILQAVASLGAPRTYRRSLGLGNLDAFFGRFSRLFLDYFQVKVRLFLDGLVKN